MKKRILLLEDDSILAQTLVELLEGEGYSITLARDGDEAADASYDWVFDLYIFDINVPDINGVELLRSLREADDKTPTIFISALVDLGSISKAFAVGAQDYIKKPFFPEELLIRVNAKFAQRGTTIKYKDLEYDPKTKTLKKNGRTIALGEVQERLFSLFIRNISQVVTQEMLLDCLEKPSSSALRVALTKLKQTTGLNIKNLRSVGYIVE
ncbi:response regulator transcription factor [Sulfurimonas sp.]|jgi:DNA-binding response OmpR family regulator|uniref:response regulator transcription factor n=1 Tax=Sulfurimonas sp. TaxID=2022749 RepID=UPI002A35C763|nr:response regulator transcription factor [Sulfurimonas sp.]MDY0124308.1 response regulator transcription factor [Sulfurimonas sp.]